MQDFMKETFIQKKFNEKMIFWWWTNFLDDQCSAPSLNENMAIRELIAEDKQIISDLP